MINRIENEVKELRIVLIDNYDSFVFNLRQLLEEAGAKVDVVHNDAFALDDLQEYDKIVFSPGPGVPDEAGLMMDVIRHYAGRKPMLGICLGEQAIGEAFGARLVNLKHVFHGRLSQIEQYANDYIFFGLPRRIQVGRYHSWVVDKKDLPDSLLVTAMSDEGQIMALRHKDYDIHGIQFHPESILTPDGAAMIANFLKGGNML